MSTQLLQRTYLSIWKAGGARKANQRPTSRPARSYATATSTPSRSTYFAPVRWDPPNDAVIASHKLLIQAGFVSKLASGIYSYLPLGLRTISKITKLIDEEMASVGGQKMNMPKLLPKELWEQTGRWNDMGNELIRLKDRKGEDFCLAPTHEEIVTSIAASNVNSHKQLPLRLYQIGDKYRDEARPRFGLLRAREFVMKDMYSFDVTKQDAMKTYQEVRGAYDRIMTRLELPYAVAEADSGNIGGNLSHEFHALASVGEDTLLCSPSTGYYANLEKAKSDTTLQLSDTQAQALKTALTAGTSIRTILRALVPVGDSSSAASSPLRATLFTDASKPGFAAVALTDSRYEANPYLVKGVAQLGADFATRALDKAGADLFVQASERLFILDQALVHAQNAEHVQDIVQQLTTSLVKEAKIETAHVKLAKVGDRALAPETSSEAPLSAASTPILEEQKGIEVGHLFYLGTKYSIPLKANVMTKEATQPIEMGCYGIGVSRLLAVSVETSHDAKGIVWPRAIAPFRATIIANTETLSNAQSALESLETLPNFKGEILFDDRKDSIGYRLKESEFIGIPYALVFGQKFNKTGDVEVVCRKEGQSLYMKVPELETFLKEKFPSSL